MPKLTYKERLIRLLQAMGYTESPTRDLRYTKFTKKDKPHIWVSSRGIWTGETLRKSKSLCRFLPDLLKKYNI